MCRNVVTVLLLALVVLTTFSNAITALKNVTVSKCCDLDEHAAKEYHFKCVMGKEEKWAPKVYSPRKKKFLTPGTVPSNWVLKAPNQPDCGGGNVTIFALNTLKTYIAFDNGSLWVPEYDKLISPNSYCIDYNVAFVCLKELQSTVPQVRIKKCCGGGAVYKDTENRCINLNVTDYKIELDDDKLLVAGFPACEGHMVIAGKLHEADLEANGSLFLREANVLLPSGEFCLEHVLENAGNANSSVIYIRIGQSGRVCVQKERFVIFIRM